LLGKQFEKEVVVVWLFRHFSSLMLGRDFLFELASVLACFRVAKALQPQLLCIHTVYFLVIGCFEK